jgi:hypothetical protein
MKKAPHDCQSNPHFPRCNREFAGSASARSYPKVGAPRRRCPKPQPQSGVSGLAKLFDHNRAWGQVRERATEGWPEG